MNCQTTAGRRNQYFLIVMFIATGLTFYFLKIHEEDITKPTLRLFKVEETLPVPGFLVHTPGCRIPEMNPFDKSVLKYIEKISFLQCSNKRPLVQSNQTSVWINEDVLQDYNVSELSFVRCCYSSLSRKNLTKNTQKKIDDLIWYNKTCVVFEESADIYDEFIQVKCTKKKVEIYKDFHAFIVPKEKNITSPDYEESNPEALSVLILGADAMSRLNFQRNMPKTKDLLRYLKAIEFFGYNKVQDNTFPNLVPLLSGYSVEEIKEFCWLNTTSFFDDCPWIWKKFSSKNYFTAFGEDACWMGLFNYVKRGFLRPPTDYYLRPYILANENQIGHIRGLNTKYCAGARFVTEVLLDYAYKFSLNMTLSNKKFWGFFWETSLTHDYLNVIPNTDELFFNLMNNLYNSNILNSTAVFFLSDHGMRWGSIRETYQGRMEEHLPFLFVLLPDWFKRKYPHAVRNMEQNTHLLTTHFDLHETLKDLLETDNLQPERLKSRMLEGWTRRAMSLFLPISAYRTCKTAGIKPTWCTCQRNRQVSIADEKVQASAKFAVNYLNKMLLNYSQCAELKLKEIISAHIEVEEEIVAKNTVDVISDYVIIILTAPGLAKFEATVRQRSDSKELTVLGDISRINIYGSQTSGSDVQENPLAFYIIQFLDYGSPPKRCDSKSVIP